MEFCDVQGQNETISGLVFQNKHEQDSTRVPSFPVKRIKAITRYDHGLSRIRCAHHSLPPQTKVSVTFMRGSAYCTGIILEIPSLVNPERTPAAPQA